MRVKEIRTPHLNLLICKLVITDEGKMVLEFKNGKRVEQYPVEDFHREINSFKHGYVS